MRKTFTIAFLALAAGIAANAQTVQDAFTISGNNYYGTARSMALGNAMTAVGGDLGSIGINPAGSAVAGYSQVTLTPGINFSSNNSSYTPVAGTRTISEMSESRSMMSMPNGGLIFNLKTGRNSGLKSISYGIVSNTTNNFLNEMVGGGENAYSSYLGSMAAAADGYDVDFLNGYLDERGQSIDQWDYAYYNADADGYYAPWNLIAGAQVGAIATFGNTSEPAYYTRYIGATEGYAIVLDENGNPVINQDGNYVYNIAQLGPVNQRYVKKVNGNKNDVLINIGFNISDKLYLGANLGIVSMNYDLEESFRERAVNPSDFPIVYSDGSTNFSNYLARYYYLASGTGVNGKFGVIWRPVGGLRLGAAIQTPTVMEVNESWKHYADVEYTNSKYNGSTSSPEGNFEYNVTTPMRYNFGIAWTLGSRLLLSYDIEASDLGRTRYKMRNVTYDDTFAELNSDISNTLGTTKEHRFGIEYKVIPAFAVRGGYSYSETPFDYDSYSEYSSVASYSLGLGYSSNGSFFLDLAGRFMQYSKETVYPYADYIDGTASPSITSSRNLFNLAVTFGWRF